jgi:MYXO-CTERM domain-containing protein
MKRVVLLSTLAAITAITGSASAVTRDEVMTRALSYAAHPWTSTTANQTASCSAAYKSLDPPGDYVGVAYNWGGYQSLFDYDKNLKAGYGAGAQETDGILSCTAGVDCSGFVSQAWGSGHFTTSDLDTTSGQITAAAMLPGDVFNQAGFHVAMFTSSLASGAPAMVEAIGYNVHTNVTGGWSHVNGYIPRRYNTITGTTVAPAVGTPTAPILIGSFPYTDARSTATSTSSTLGGCGLAPTTSEGGPEYVYQATFAQPGTLNVNVAYDAGVDIDVELFAPLTTFACTARGDTAFSKQVGCGTYTIVADTFSSKAKAGAYTLNATFTPSGQPCSAVPGPTFNPKGKLGDACAYPGKPDLPFCNENLGGSDTCIYGASSSYCSKACAKDLDCTGMPGGGCCQDISGKGEFYCQAAASCPGGVGSSGTSGTSGGTSGTSGGTSGASGTSGTSGASGTGDPAGAGDPASGAAPDPGASTTTTTGGCATSSSDATPWPAFLVVLGALAIASRRRRA